MQSQRRGDVNGDRLADRRESGPLKDIVANQDSLYKYISWQDPARTVGSYFAALGFLLAVHHLHLTQLALKTSAIGLGIMSVAEFAGRSFGPDNFVSRLRPRHYKTVPESTLNATLKDIHDFVQYAVVQAQRILFGEDLEKTFGAFVVTTSLYFLTQIMSPFGIAVLALTTIYIIPLIASPRGQEVARDGMVRAQELSNAAVDKGSALAQDGKTTVTNLSSRAQDTAGDLRRRAGNMVQSGMDTAANLPATVRNSVSGTSNKTGDAPTGHASDLTSSVPHNSSEPTQARDITSRADRDTTDLPPAYSTQSRNKAASHVPEVHFGRQQQTGIDSSSESWNDPTGISQGPQSTFDNLAGHPKATVSTFPEGTNDDYATQPRNIGSAFSHGITDDNINKGESSILPQNTLPVFPVGTAGDLPSSDRHRSSDFSRENFPSSTHENLPSFAQNISSNYSKFPHNVTDQGRRPEGGGVQSSVNDSNYYLQNRMGGSSDYNSSVPRGAPNRGQFGTGTGTSSGQMPIGELIDEAKQAGDSAPPLSAGGLKTMK
ncbi:hypothetical protein F66182_4383 [Fusarium sp. NRRL 66182]|nr:hypothetical protein F66182_4383 [Fusarium sp. NRRL 66182]